MIENTRQILSPIRLTGPYNYVRLSTDHNSEPSDDKESSDHTTFRIPLNEYVFRRRISNANQRAGRPK